MPNLRHALSMAGTIAAAAFLLSACSSEPEVETVPLTTAEAACLEAVSATTGGAPASVISSVPTKTGTNVNVAVEGAEAPWACEVGTDGATVLNVEYTGSEGYL
ncbi:hypothetical protein [Amaricoccus macauensis]|uniref:hypothetical protein n=1 Tax=Amaricoccus macauensis TaxID=57001 RepID=UPI003C7A84DA